MAAAVALGGVVYTMVQAREAQVAQQAAETELLTAPDVQTYSAAIRDGGQVSFVVSKSLNCAMFIGKDLPSVGADQTYQLWTLEGERAIPDNLVAGGGDCKEFFRETLRCDSPRGERRSCRWGAAANPLHHSGSHRTAQLRVCWLPAASVGGAWKAVGVPEAGFDGGEGVGPARATLDKRRGDIAAMFDRVASRYDLANDVLSLGQDRAWRREVTQAVAPRPGQLILDVAAGTGTSSEPIAQAGATVIATDLSIGMLVVGRQRRPELSFVAADALQLPYADRSFHAVTISFGLRNVEDTVAALNEMRRVIKPGGTLVVCEFSTPTWRPFRTLYSNYLVAALPRIARLVSSSPAAYEYLAESIQAWPDQQGLATMIEECGWHKVEWRNLSGGIVALHRAIA
jgi:demethylmenaquinone methyltransferase / 2-methoxy-6-polyprenyl-1,4-benzoquinol methylase